MFTSLTQWIRSHPLSQLSYVTESRDGQEKLLASLLSNRQFEGLDCLLFFNRDRVNRIVGSDLPVDIFHSYGPSPIFDDALTREEITYCLIDSYTLWMASPLAERAQGSSTIRCVFLDTKGIPYPKMDGYLRIETRVPTQHKIPLPINLDARGLVTLLILNGHKQQLVCLPGQWIPPVESLLQFLTLKGKVVIRENLSNDVNSPDCLYLLNSLSETDRVIIGHLSCPEIYHLSNLILPPPIIRPHQYHCWDKLVYTVEYGLTVDENKKK